VSRLATAALLLGLIGNAVGRTFVFVVLPPLGRQLGFTDLQTGSLLSATALLLIVVAPLWGFASERLGRRPVLLVGLAATSLAPAGLGWVVAARLDGTLAVLTALTLLGAIRLCQAALAGGLMPTAQAYMADITPPERRVQGMGLLGASFGIGAILGPALAWRLGGNHAALAFALICALAACGFLGACAWLTEPTRPPAPLRNGAAIPLPQVWPFLLITLCGITAYGVVQQVTTLRLQDALGLSFQEAIAKAGSALTLTSLMMVCVQGLLVRGLHWRPERLLLLGASGALLSLLALAVAPHYAAMLVAMLVLGGSLGLFFPGNLAVLSLRTGIAAQGKIAGINAIGQGLGSAASPLLGAALHQLSPVAPFVAMSGVLALATLLALYGTRRCRPEAATEG
jgi:MFS family permease